MLDGQTCNEAVSTQKQSKQQPDQTVPACAKYAYNFKVKWRRSDMLDKVTESDSM